MKLKIDEINRRFVFELNSDEWYIGKVDDQKYVLGYALMPKIDRSFKGKDPDVGCPRILLDDDQYNRLKLLIDEVIVW